MTSPSETKPETKVTKTKAKPAAKPEAFKRRGRPAGSKNKPKKVVITATQAAIAEKLGVPVTEYAKEVVKLKRKDTAKKQSVAMKERWTRTRKLVQDNIQLMDDNSILLRQVTNLEHQIIGFRAVISYLEMQIGLKRSQ